MFEALYCDLHSKSAELVKAHLDITQRAKPYNKEEYSHSHGVGVCNVQWCLDYKYADRRFRIEPPSGRGLQLVSE